MPAAGKLLDHGEMGTRPKQEVAGLGGGRGGALYDDAAATKPLGDLGSDGVAVGGPNGDEPAVGFLPNARAALAAADPLEELRVGGDNVMSSLLFFFMGPGTEAAFGQRSGRLEGSPWDEDAPPPAPPSTHTHNNNNNNDDDDDNTQRDSVVHGQHHTWSTRTKSSDRTFWMAVSQTHDPLEAVLVAAPMIPSAHPSLGRAIQLQVAPAGTPRATTRRARRDIACFLA